MTAECSTFNQFQLKTLRRKLGDPHIFLSELYSAVKMNVVKGCLSAVLLHATFVHVYRKNRKKQVANGIDRASSVSRVKKYNMWVVKKSISTWEDVQFNVV